jgi:dihydrofolate reductase
MEVIIVVAMAQNRVIGRDNQLPWHIPEELAMFKKVTIGHPIIMGRKTFDSLPGLLPGREHIVLSRDVEYEPEGAIHAISLADALAYCQTHKHNRVSIIGGSEVFKEGFNVATVIRLTLLNREVKGDVYLPPIPVEDFEVVDTQTFDKASEKFTVIVYRRCGKEA